MAELKINAVKREKTGIKSALSSARANMQIPAVVYGENMPPVSITVSLKDFNSLLKSGSNTIVNLEMSGESDKAILKTVQYHAVTDSPIHIDFQRISMKKKIDVVVPVKLHGECADIKLLGAILDHSVREITVRCLPTDMPHEIVVDISGLTLHKGITVADLKLPDGVEAKEEPTRVLVHLLMPREEAVATPETSAAEQPEVIAKGKKDEEGAEGADAKAGAKPDAKATAPKADAKAAPKK